MAEAAALVEKVYEPDFLDLNFGCPVKKVVSRNGGSGCLRDLDLVEGIIRAVRGAIEVPLEVSDEKKKALNVAISQIEKDASGHLFYVTGAADGEDLEQGAHARCTCEPFHGSGDAGDPLRYAMARSSATRRHPAANANAAHPLQ